LGTEYFPCTCILNAQVRFLALFPFFSRHFQPSFFFSFFFHPRRPASKSSNGQKKIESGTNRPQPRFLVEKLDVCGSTKRVERHPIKKKKGREMGSRQGDKCHFTPGLSSNFPKQTSAELDYRLCSGPADTQEKQSGKKNDY